MQQKQAGFGGKGPLSHQLDPTIPTTAPSASSRTSCGYLDSFNDRNADEDGKFAQSADVTVNHWTKQSCDPIIKVFEIIHWTKLI